MVVTSQGEGQKTRVSGEGETRGPAKRAILLPHTSLPRALTTTDRKTHGEGRMNYESERNARPEGESPTD